LTEDAKSPNVSKPEAAQTRGATLAGEDARSAAVPKLADESAKLFYRAPTQPNMSREDLNELADIFLNRAVDAIGFLDSSEVHPLANAC